MSKVGIIYWSGTGNTEAMAELVAEGVREAGGQAELIAVSDADVASLDEYDALALGCPAMGDEELEDGEFEPFYDEAEPKLVGRKVAFFGSYAWNEGAWMENWRSRAESAGVTPIDTLICYEYPDEEAEACKELGAKLAQ